MGTDDHDILKVLKENLQAAQNQRKLYVDRHRVEHSFEVGDLVYLRLLPYRQSSLKKKGGEEVETPLLWSLQSGQKGWRGVL